MTKKDLIVEYQTKMDIIDECIDDLDRNIKIARKDQDKFSVQLNEMIATHRSFLTQYTCYNEFIKKLK